MRIAIACGGTGGHTFPGLATGTVLASRGHDVEILSAGRAIEGATLKGWEGEIFPTAAPKSPAKHMLALLASTVRTVRHFRRNRPAAVLAMGSYASLPPVLAARWLRIPVVLHEANAILGKSIASLARFASAVAVSFPEGESFAKLGGKVVRTGLPVRVSLLDQKPLDCFGDAPCGAPCATIFVTGGSQGAYEMNKRVADALAVLAGRSGAPRFRVIHQTGRHEDALEDTRRRYAAAGIEAKVFDFIPEMGGAFKAADIVIARSGAATCAEIALFGKPALFIPLPTAVRDHQFLNARHLADAGAAAVIRQEKCDPESLADAIAPLLSDSARRAAMASAAHALAVPDAAERLASLVEEKAQSAPARC